MKKIVLLLFIVFIFISTFAKVEATVNLTPRILGMGGAYTAIANDLSALVYNPAGISNIGYLGATSNIGLRTTDSDSILDLINKLENIYSSEDKEKIINSFNLNTKANLQVFTGANISNFALGLNVYNDLSKENEDIVNNKINTEALLGFGEEINISKPYFDSLYYGLILKLIHTNNYSFYRQENEIEKTKETAASFALNSGLMLKFNEIITLGLQVENFFAPEYKLKGNSSNFNGDNTIITPEKKMRVGLAINVPLINTTLAADIANISLDNNSELNTVTHLGLEKNLLLNTIFLRGGSFTSPEGNRIYTLGLGLNLLALKVDVSIGTTESMEEEKMMAFATSINF